MKSIFAQVLGLAAIALAASSSAFAYGGAAAIVFNPQTGAWGAYHGDSDRVSAEQDAMNKCGNDCMTDIASLENRTSVVRETWAMNGWISYARGANGAWGTAGVHDTQYDAERSALANCGGDAKNCCIVRTISSYDFQDDVVAAPNAYDCNQ